MFLDLTSEKTAPSDHRSGDGDLALVASSRGECPVAELLGAIAAASINYWCTEVEEHMPGI